MWEVGPSSPLPPQTLPEEKNVAQSLKLYRAVGALNRVALGDLSAHEYYVAESDPSTGIIKLVPVDIVGVGTKRVGAADQDDDSDTPE